MPMWVVFALLRGMANVFLTFAFFYGVWWYLFTWLPEKDRRTFDPIYARDLFAGRLPVAEVLATRRFHAKDAEAWDCTYAIVRLGPEAPEQPPTWQDVEIAWDLRFGGDWRRTPAPHLGQNTRDAVAFCAQYWPPSLVEEIHAGLSTVGAWHVRGPVGETVFLYDLERSLAARIRFGD